MVSFYHDTPTPEIYTLSLHDALPISRTRRRSASSTRRSRRSRRSSTVRVRSCTTTVRTSTRCAASRRSEEHTSELQSHSDLVCRLLLEKKNKENKESIRYTLRNAGDT